MRPKAYRRYKNYTKAKRKRDLDKALSTELYDAKIGENKQYLFYDNLHQYSKNKIHCSCPMCSAKTRNKGKRRRNKPYAPSINYTMMDLRRQQAMDADEEEFNEEPEIS